jgi:hypothetical protein
MKSIYYRKYTAISEQTCMCHHFEKCEAVTKWSLGVLRYRRSTDLLNSEFYYYRVADFRGNAKDTMVGSLSISLSRFLSLRTTEEE